MNSGESGKKAREMFQSVVATSVARARAMNLIFVEGVQEGDQKRLFGWAVAMATTRHYDERVRGEEQEMEMMERAVTMAMKIIQTCLPRPPLPVYYAPWGIVPSSDGSWYDSKEQHELSVTGIGGSFELLEQTPAYTYYPSYTAYPPPSSYPAHPPSFASYPPYPSWPSPSNSSNGIMYAGPGYGGGGDNGVSGGSQTVFLDYSGGRFVAIPINTLQQGDHAGFLATARNAKGKVAQNALMSAFGGVVPLCFSTLDDALKDNCPDYIRAATYAGLVAITGITFVGLLSKTRAKAALRVVASAAIAAVSTTIVYKVPENVYIKATCGVLGALATFATMAIDW